MKKMPPELTARCRNILVQVDGKRSLDEIRNILRGLDKLDEAIKKLVEGGYVQVAGECREFVKSIVVTMLGSTAATLLKKLDEMHTKYGDACWEHLEELEKTARLFYGEVVADNLKTEIKKLLAEMKKQ